MILGIYLLTVVISVVLLCVDFKLNDLDVCVGDLLFFTFISLIPVASLIAVVLTLITSGIGRTEFLEKKLF